LILLSKTSIIGGKKGGRILCIGTNAWGSSSRFF